MAFSVPLPVASKGLRTDRPSLAQHKAYLQEREDKFKATTDLFCNKCLQKHLIRDAYGFCKVCMDFLCRQCVNAHESTLFTLNHGIIVGAELMERYHHAMRKDKPKGKHVSRSHLDMVADGRASLQYFEADKGTKAKSEDVADGAFDAQLLKNLKIRVISDTRKCFICACVVYNDGKIIVADANNKTLKLFNKHHNFLHTFHMKREPWDICRAVDYTTDLFATESQTNGFHQLKVTDEIRYMLTVKVKGECFGITDWKGGIAVSVKLETKEFCIKLMDQFGNIHRVIPDGFEMQLQLRSPWYLASLKKGRYIVISDAGTGAVTCIAVEGGIKFMYKNRKELKDPRNIASDMDNNIFVVDYETDTVHQLSPQGEDLGVILCGREGLVNPCGIACHKEFLYIQAKMDSNFLNLYELA
ncbi:hypothetical protein DPMN_097586 [Dreissena polymorpha]|uniref:B box-type domain-containing protein n=1 Tax=Dreissena polymorpha TaxID=45954 RepID=A0A9D4LD60_DREPO|nr:hypothetical protein DPMN_097586 [Dreissena polymorpha]